MQESVAADDESSEPTHVTRETPTAAVPARAGDFERYGLLAAVTLVVLCLLLADRMRPSARRADLPAGDRLVRLQIGGDRPRAAGPPQRKRDAADPGVVRGGSPPVPEAPPGPSPPARPEPESARTHVVRSGETLAAIARAELGTSRRAGEIAALNGLADPDVIRAGQTLRLPPR